MKMGIEKDRKEGLEKGLGPIVHLFVRRLGRSLSEAKHADFAASHISSWLLQTKRLDQCLPLVEVSTGSSATARIGLIHYFVQTDCKDAAPLVVVLLSNDSSEVRVMACNALAKIGNQSHVAKMKVLAETDQTNRVVERPRGSGFFVKDYFVAETCRTAVGKILLRH